MKRRSLITGVMGALLVGVTGSFALRGTAGETASNAILETASAGAAEVVESGIEPSEEEVQLIIEEFEANAWKNPGSLVMANVYESVNVRREPSEDAERAGVLYKDCGGTIIEYTDSWTHISSGELDGWVRNDFLLFGQAAEELCREVGVTRAEVLTDALRVRTEPNTDSATEGVVGTGEIYDVISEEDGWVAIDFEGQIGYISEEYLSLSFHIDYGETVEAIAAREEEERKAREAAEKARREAERIQYYGVYAASASDEALLGALIWCEAGNQPYEGMVAVGAVVMNRLRSPAYPGSLYGVIYASGQFTPAGSGAVDRRIAAGVPEACLQAARDALGGYSNVGAATHFRPVGWHDGIVIGGHVFW